MAAVANIQEAIDDIVPNVFFGGNVEYDAWMISMFTPVGFGVVAVGSAEFWDAQSVDQRTVFDWVVPSLNIQRLVNAAGNGIESSNLRINIVLRVLLAVQAAQDATRISQDQEDTVVAAYNAAF